MMQDLKNLLIVSRPFIALVPPLFFALSFIMLSHSFSFSFWIMLLALFIPYNLFLYGINDIFDYSSDLVNKRKESTIDGFRLTKSLSQKYIPYFIFGALFLLVASFISKNIYVIAFIPFYLFISYFYSAPPLRFKIHPPLDMLASSFIYFTGPFLLGILYSPHSINFIYIKKIIAISLFAISAHALSTLIDYSSDFESGDTTIAVKLGRKNTFFLAYAVMLLVTFFTYALFSALIKVLIIFSLVVSLLFYPFLENERILRKLMILMYLSVLAVTLFKIYLALNI